MVCQANDDRTAVADYISDLTAELAVMAAWAEHTDLARILEMARLESEQLCGRSQCETAEAAESAVVETPMAQDAAGQFEPTNVVLMSVVRAAQK
jgi:hypothetical protein